MRLLFGSNFVLASVMLVSGLRSAKAQSQVVVTVSGTVENGSEGNPSATPPNAGSIFGVGPDLKGQAFTLTLTFDPTQGQSQYQSCPDGSIFHSTDMGGPALGPTAVLQIGNGSYTFGTHAVSRFFWSTSRDGPNSCTSYYNALGFCWDEVYTGNYGGESGIGCAGLSMGPANIPTLPNGDWRSSFPPTAVGKNSEFGFNINLYQPGKDVYSGTLLAYANGYLNPTVVAVSGFIACPTMPLGGGPFFKIDDPVESVPSSMPGSAICPSTEDIMKKNLSACPGVTWTRAEWYDELLFHKNFDVYKQNTPGQRWGAECAYYPSYYPSAGLLVPNGASGHGTANYWPDGTCAHFIVDPGGPRWADIIAKTSAYLLPDFLRPPACAVVGDDYNRYWATTPHPPGVQ